jgi:hypothetical protein
MVGRLALLEDVGEVAAGGGGLEAGVEAGRGVDRAARQDATDHLVSARMPIEVKLGADMPEEMDVQLDAGEPEDVLHEFSSIQTSDYPKIRISTYPDFRISGNSHMHIGT